MRLRIPLGSCGLLGLLLVVVGAASPAWAQADADLRAVVVKAVKDVGKQPPGQNGDTWERAVPLDQLTSGYRLRTAEAALALLRFADETKLIVREKSVLEIRGRMEDDKFRDREVDMAEGAVAFTVVKAANETFRFSSPTGVASIRGTEGLFEVGDSTKLVIVVGLADLLNPITGATVEVGPGQTGVSGPDGSLYVRPASTDELALPGEAGVPLRRRIEIPGRNPDGTPRTLIIEWDEAQ